VFIISNSCANYSKNIVVTIAKIFTKLNVGFYLKNFPEILRVYISCQSA